MIYPDYKGKGIINLMSSIKQVLGGKSKYKKLDGLDLKFKNNLVLLVIDGLGYEYLTKKCKGSFLSNNLKGKMTSVFPSSTASAVTTLQTGLSPLEHGIPGWRVFYEEIGGIIHPLPFEFWQNKISLEKRGIKFPEVYAKKSFYEEIKIPAISIAKKIFVKSSYTIKTQKGAKFIPFNDLDGLFLEVKKACEPQGKKFIYAYWGEFDSIAHRKGTKSGSLKRHFLDIDKRIEQLAKDLEGAGTTLIITADHGHLENKYINISKNKKLSDCLLLPICGEPRYAYCYVKKGKEKEFENTLKNKYRKYLNFYKSAELIKRGLFGLFNEHEKFLDRVGNYTIIMKDNYALSDFFTLTGRKKFFKSNHGGLHKDEMFVPLIIVDFSRTKL
jgi:hypothetical protein